MPTCYMLIGVPGSGKSTYIETFKKEINILSLSTDEYIEKIAFSKGLSYSDVYQDEIKNATTWFNSKIKETAENQIDFIWDQTNLNIKARKHKLNILKSANYEVHAIAFEVDPDILYKRLEKRELDTGKKIPEKIIMSMLDTYQRPTQEEGFSSISLNNGFGNIKQLASKQNNQHKI